MVLFCGLSVSGCLNSGGTDDGTDKNNSEKNNSAIITGASFYVDDLNVEKVSDEEVLDTLVKIIRNYEVITIQGVKDPNGEAMKTLVNAVNTGTDADGKAYNYQYNLSSPVGNAGDEEQYTYIYNRNVLYPSSIPQLYNDSNNAFEKDPYMIAFRAYEGQGQVLFVIFTASETNTKAEIDAIPEMIENIKKVYAGHETISVLGNFRADYPYYDKTSASPAKSSDLIWVIPDNAVTSTEGNYAYDRFVATSNLKNYYGGSSGVFNFSEAYGLNQTQTEAVSTHYPIYVEYYPYPATS
ncbi:hypothetical protein [Methanimicrococcus hongohii]|nr:hypothetical protein [Methanimicrococcus sp. Hf6]